MKNIWDQCPLCGLKLEGKIGLTGGTTFCPNKHYWYAATGMYSGVAEIDFNGVKETFGFDDGGDDTEKFHQRVGEIKKHMGDDRPFMPDWVSPPGDSIKAVMREKRMTVEEFAGKIGRPVEWANGLLKGVELIDGGVAARLEKVVGSTKDFWLRREARYRSEKIRLGK